VYEFRWNRWNVDHIAEHGVALQDAEYVVNKARAPWPEKIGDGKRRVWGRRDDGTYLQVIYVFSPGDVVFVIHAMPLTEQQKHQSQEIPMKQTKPFWEMTAAELRKATHEFDDPAYQPPALPQTQDDVAQQRRAKNKGGRPRKGLGARTISLTVERALLARSDAYAKRLGISRAELVQRGLNAIVPTQPKRERRRAG
jgi:hypothetical protein